MLSLLVTLSLAECCTSVPLSREAGLLRARITRGAEDRAAGHVTTELNLVHSFDDSVVLSLALLWIVPPG